MKKKLLSMLLTTVIALSFFCTACNNKGGGEVIKDGKTVNVKIISAGYGTTFVTALAEKFNALYANSEEGYKINVLPARENLGNTIMLQDIYSNSGVDVYWCSVPVDLAVNGQYGECIEDITESVFNQKAIKFDGSTEEKTIKEKVDESDFVLDDTQILGSKYYAVPSVVGTAGFAVNLKVLENYDLEIPRTTDEMWECADKIMESAKTTAVFPFAYSISGNGYTSLPLQYWFGQYIGEQNWKKFWSMEEDGVPMTEPYKVFEMEGIDEALYNFCRMYDKNLGSYGSMMQDFRAAQGQLMMGEALFMATGSWMYNEEYVTWGDYKDDITFVKIPVISELGYKLFGDIYDEAKCDDILSAICAGVDENKEISEIKAQTESELGVTLDVADVERVAEARGTAVERSGGGWYLNKKSDDEIKKIAALFMRMCASYEGASLMAEHTSETQFFAPDALSGKNNAWFTEQVKTLTNKYVTLIKASNTGYRNKIGVGDAMFPYMTQFPVNEVLKGELTVYDSKTYEKTGDLSIFKTQAENFVTEIYNHAKSQYDNGIWKES